VWVTLEIDDGVEEGGYLELNYSNTEKDGGIARTSSSFGAIERTVVHGDDQGYN